MRTLSASAHQSDLAGERLSLSWQRMLFVAIVLFSLFTAIVPFCRAFYRMEVNYNEGWNVYTAADLAQGIPLYGTRVGWTTANYPSFSFLLIRELSRATHDYLFTGRMLSLFGLLISCVLVACIVTKVTGKFLPAALSGVFCLALFCARAPGYVGMDDPQMLAQAFFVGGLLLYVSRTPTQMILAGTALLFVVGGNFKHNAIDFPFAVFLDLLISSRRRALEFLAYAAVFLTLAVLVNILVGGPFFIPNLLTPRVYSFASGARLFLAFYGPIQIPLAAAAIASCYALKKPGARVVALLFMCSLAIGMGFAGGSGVSINAFFSNMIAMAVLVGISAAVLCDENVAIALPVRAALPLVIFASLIFPMQNTGELNPIAKLRDARMSELRFERETAFLKSQPGPALCESLLRCYFAAKPYRYDPFNSTSLIRLGKINATQIMDRIQRREYGAIQMYSPLESMPHPNDHFVDEILDVIGKNYQLGLHETDCSIYIPK